MKNWGKKCRQRGKEKCVEGEKVCQPLSELVHFSVPWEEASTTMYIMNYAQMDLGQRSE